jgi:YegS/Rv2252/BmrU family lipid kinase
LFLANPRAREGAENTAQAVSLLADLGLDLVVEAASDPSRFPELIGRHRGRIDRVIVGGGDGTLNAAVQVLVEANLPLGIIPLGTANNLARTLGIPADIEAACAASAGHLRRRIDLGRVNDRYFCTTASLGLSVQITEELSAEAKRRWGSVAYALTAIRVMRRARPMHADIEWEGGTRHTRTVQIVVGNGRHYGAALAVAEDAAIDDARLDLYSLEVGHWWELLKLAPSLKRGTHGKRTEVAALRARSFVVRTRRPVPIDLDGELGAETPGHFRVVPRALEVLVPAETEE